MNAIDEWWIDEHGDTTYANGDIGDSNHEAVVHEQALRMLADALGWDAGDDGVDFYGGELREIVDRWLMEDKDMTQDEADNVDSTELKKFSKELGIEPHLIDAAWDRAKEDAALGVRDLREYAMKYWGWIQVQRDHVSLYKLDRKTLEALCRGMDDILEQAGIDADDPGYRVEEINIHTMSPPNGYYTIQLGELHDRAYDALIVTDEPERAPLEQVTKMDDAIAEPYYKGKKGD